MIPGLKTKVLVFSPNPDDVQEFQYMPLDVSGDMQVYNEFLAWTSGVLGKLMSVPREVMVWTAKRRVFDEPSFSFYCARRRAESEW